MISHIQMYLCVNIGTFDVLSAATSVIPGGVTVSGNFNDNAEGCFITLTSEASDSNDMFVALPDTNGSANVTGLGTSNYTARIYDLENGLPGRRPAVEIDGVGVTGVGEGEQEHMGVVEYFNKIFYTKY